MQEATCAISNTVSNQTYVCCHVTASLFLLLLLLYKTSQMTLFAMKIPFFAFLTGLHRFRMKQQDFNAWMAQLTLHYKNGIHTFLLIGIVYTLLLRFLWLALCELLQLHTVYGNGYRTETEK